MSTGPASSQEPLTQTNPDANRPRRNLYVKVFQPDGTSEMHEVDDWPLDVTVSLLANRIAREEGVPVDKVRIYIEIPQCFTLEDFWVSSCGPQRPLHARVEE